MVDSVQSPHPIFVLGLQRSGTTWLANTLAEHPSIAAVKAAEHRGVHESIFFSHFARAFGDLREDATFEHFAANFCASDYFLITGLSADWFRSLRPRSYPDAFRLVMDEYARKQGASHWLEKSPHHTLLAPELAKAFPDARFICVTRNPTGLLRSRIHAPGRPEISGMRRTLSLLEGCAAHALYERKMRAFQESYERCTSTTFEAMHEDLNQVLRDLTAFLDLSQVDSPATPRFGANSSFGSEAERNRAFGAGDRFTVACGMPLVRSIPLTLLTRWEERRRQKRGIDWPDWCWTRQPRPDPNA